MTIRYHFHLKETIATILADRQEDIDAACQGMRDARLSIERYIRQDPYFQISFEPVKIQSSDPLIIAMGMAADAASVGPMASVAGAVAKAGVEAAIASGSRYCLIDNGGDITFISDRKIRIGLYAGESPLSVKYAFVIDPQKGIYSVCTSSATVGHSISLGVADSVSVFARDPVLADAYATSICNHLTVDDQDILDSIPPEIDGVYAVFHDTGVIWGDVPPIVPAHVDERLITMG